MFSLEKGRSSLWTRDFTIISIGTMISMLGNSLSGFAIGLLVLDNSGSVFLYALFMVAYNVPRVIVPVAAGPFLDNFSRKKTIYTLDFFSSALYLVLYFVILGGRYSYWSFLAVSVLVGSVDSAYSVAYDSLYPNLITPGNYSKAYSISSMIYPLAAVMTPVAAYAYQTVGMAPLFLFNSVSFLIAAIFETRISAEEKYIRKSSEHFGFSAYKKTLHEGIEYIKGEKGLQIITIYFCITMFCDSASSTVMLPFFKASAWLGVMAYTYVMAFGVAGRFIGGAIHYRFRYPTDKKFTIALFVYFTISVIAVVFLFVPIPAMMVCQFIVGILGVTSFNIRISATQNHVPDSCRARFNGTFQMICTIGSIAGQLIGGAAAELIPYRTVVVIFSAVNIAAVFAVMYRGREDVKPIYNRQV